METVCLSKDRTGKFSEYRDLSEDCGTVWILWTYLDIVELSGYYSLVWMLWTYLGTVYSLPVRKHWTRLNTDKFL